MNLMSIKYSGEETVERFKEYLEWECKILDRVLELGPSHQDRIAEINQTMARCCGVAFFMQNFAEFEIIDEIYHEYWNRLMNLKLQ